MVTVIPIVELGTTTSTVNNSHWIRTIHLTSIVYLVFSLQIIISKMFWFWNSKSENWNWKWKSCLLLLVLSWVANSLINWYSVHIIKNYPSKLTLLSAWPWLLCHGKRSWVKPLAKTRCDKRPNSKLNSTVNIIYYYQPMSENRMYMLPETGSQGHSAILARQRWTGNWPINI